MPFKNLREYIAALESAGELVRISEEADPYLEISCAADRMCRQTGKNNKAILFENVKGSSMPVLMNAFGNERRQCMMAGVENYAQLTDKLGQFLEILQEPRRTMIEKIGALPMLRDVARCFPKYVKRAPCQDIVWRGDEIDLTRIPILTTWPEDAGPFVTLPLVFTIDPVDGKRNCGMYRLQRYDKKTLGFHCHTHHTGADHIRKAKAQGKDRLELAVAIGAAPSVTFGAVVPLPPGLDEMIFSGFLSEAPVSMVQCVSIDNQVPTSAEIVIEGYVNVDERRREGPFGDHTGFYSLADDYWVLHVTAVTMRKNPVYHATVVGPPPQEDSHIAEAIERLFLPLMRQPIPEVDDYHLPFEGVAHNLMLCRIHKTYPGQGKKVAHAVWGLGQAMFTKAIVVGDDDMLGDLKDYPSIVKRMARDVDVSRDIEFIKGPTETLDHATRALYFGSKVSIDITRAFSQSDGGGDGIRTEAPIGKSSPTDAEILSALQSRVPQATALHTAFDGEWRHLTLVALDKRDHSATEKTDLEPGVRDTSVLMALGAGEVVRILWELYPDLPCAQRIVVFDCDEDLSDYSRLVWLGLASIDPERDCHFDDKIVEEFGHRVVKRHPRRIGIDCTTKSAIDGFTRRWPKEQRHGDELLSQVKSKWGW